MNFTEIALLLGILSISGAWSRPQSEGYSYPVPDIPFDYLPPPGSERNEQGRGPANLLPPLPSFTTAQVTVKPAITVRPVVSQAPLFPFTSSETSITDNTTTRTGDPIGFTRTSPSTSFNVKKSSSNPKNPTTSTLVATLVNSRPTSLQPISSRVPSGTIEVITSKSSRRPSAGVTRPVQRTKRPSTTRLQPTSSSAGHRNIYRSSTTSSKADVRNTGGTMPSGATRVRTIITSKPIKPTSTKKNQESTRQYTYQTKSTSTRPTTSQTSIKRRRPSTTRRVTSKSPSSIEIKRVPSTRRTQSTTPFKKPSTNQERKTTYSYQTPTTTKKQTVNKNQKLFTSLQPNAPVRTVVTTEATQPQRSQTYSTQQVTTYRPKLTQTGSTQSQRSQSYNVQEVTTYKPNQTQMKTTQPQRSQPDSVQVTNYKPKLSQPAGGFTKSKVKVEKALPGSGTKEIPKKISSSSIDNRKSDTKSNKAMMMHMSRPYEFGYAVDDSDTSNTFSQKESSDGMVITGEYRWKMPDGRTQIVTYLADWAEGFYPSIRYE